MDVFKFVANIIKKIVGFIFDVCFIILFIYGATFIPYLVGYKAMCVNSNDAGYYKGTLIYYNSVDIEELRIDDYILVKNNDKYEIYTVGNVIDDIIYVNNSEINYTDVYGKIAPVSIPVIGYFVQFLDSHVMLVYVLLGLIVIDIIFSGIKIIPRKRLE